MKAITQAVVKLSKPLAIAILAGMTLVLCWIWFTANSMPNKSTVVYINKLGEAGIELPIFTILAVLSILILLSEANEAWKTGQAMVNPQ